MGFIVAIAVVLGVFAFTVSFGLVDGSDMVYMLNRSWDMMRGR